MEFKFNPTLIREAEFNAKLDAALATAKQEGYDEGHEKGRQLGFEQGERTGRHAATAAHVADLRFQLARDLLVAHARKHGMTTNPDYKDLELDRDSTCQSAAWYADRLLKILAEPQEGGE